MTAHDTTAVAMAMALRDSVRRFVRAVRSESGTVTTAQSEVLAQLERSGPASVAVLAEARGVKHQSMRLVVARLVELGWLALTPDPVDGRSQIVSLTRKGRAEVKREQAARSTYLAGVIADRLTAREVAVLKEAVTLLDKLSSED